MKIRKVEPRHGAAAGLLALLCGTTAALSAQPLCDKDLLVLASESWGYKLRGARCEGAIEKPRESGSTLLFLVSLTQSFEAFDANLGTPLKVHWPVLGEGNVTLRAEEVPDLLYRMNTSLEAPAKSFSWPAEGLYALGLQSRDLGVVGWTRHAVGDREPLVHLPLRIWQQKEPDACGPYRLVLYNSERLKELRLSVARLGPEGRPEETLKDGEELGQFYYPEEETIELSVPYLDGPGIYFFKFVATRHGDELSVPVDYWIYHDGSPSECGH